MRGKQVVIDWEHRRLAELFCKEIELDLESGRLRHLAESMTMVATAHGLELPLIPPNWPSCPSAHRWDEDFEERLAGYESLCEQGATSKARPRQRRDFDSPHATEGLYLAFFTTLLGMPGRAQRIRSGG